MSAGDWLLLLVAGVAGGLAGSIAGLASVATYPALLATGLGPVAANVTNTVSLMAYTAGSVSGSQPELTGQAPRVRRLGAAALLGGATGCGLLLLTSEATFEHIAPLLIAGASLAILTRPSPRPQPETGHGDGAWLPAGVFLTGIYGGYFGAAAGVIMLALLLLGTGEALARANGLRNVLLGFANGVAAIGFALLAPVEWLAIVPLAAGLFAGGRLGPVVVRHAPAGALRLLIGLAGLTLAAVLALDAY